MDDAGLDGTAMDDAGLDGAGMDDAGLDGAAMGDAAPGDEWHEDAWQQRLAAEDAADAAARGPAPETRAFSAAARRYRALSEPVRLHMLHVLEQGPQTVSELGALLRLSVSAASRHTAQLEAAGFIERERQAHYVVCRALVRGWAQPDPAAEPGSAPAPPAEEDVPGGRSRVARDLLAADPDAVRFYISFGMSVLEHVRHDHEDWKFKMEDWFGPGIRPHLDVIGEAIRRAMADESLEGLRLPEEVIVEGWDL